MCLLALRRVESSRGGGTGAVLQAMIAAGAAGRWRKLYEEAHNARLEGAEIDKSVLESFGGKVGAIMYAAPGVRADVNQTVSLLSRALTFPTPELEKCVDKLLLYMAHTSHLGITYDGRVPDAALLKARSDSDWAVGHSTTGWHHNVAGGAVGHSSKRQPCITTSSCEAEIVAASTCAVEIMYVRGMMREMGAEQLEPTRLDVDNDGAVALSRDRKSCNRSRHIDRRFFKVRELQACGTLKVFWIPTAENSADLLTKALERSVFEKHRDTIMNIESCAECSE
jgi:hypothetical protein